MMEPIFIEIWAFAPAKDGKWTMRAWSERPDWRPEAKYYLVKIPVPAELIGSELQAEVSEAGK